jgi:hypothetical protein
MKATKLLLIFLVVASFSAEAQNLLAAKGSNGFPVVSAGGGASIVVDDNDHLLVQKAAAFLQQDIEAVSGKKPQLSGTPSGKAKNIVLIGSLDKSPLLQQLVQQKKINVGNLTSWWEGYHIQVVAQPFAGVESALVIAGADRRGAAYGVFELSRQMGVSPWYYWADVPVKKSSEILVAKGPFTDAPKVKYRGIFINDEAPALSSWSKEQFGGFNHKFYEKVCELVLRLKGNYLWPAMWGSAFYDDDPKNIEIAEAYGVVIGTSHHEPLMRAHDEWRRYDQGKWNYDSNAVKLQEFWRGGMQRATNEKIVSVGMRGDGDEPMSRETATALLERIVADQRKIIADVTGKPASATPQLWALYKEVQDYYDKGMRVPDDVTLLLADDNWGNLRKLPKLDEKPRSGGYGIYYHFDYVGGPRNYKWLNTNNLARVWEQMHLAWEYGARQIWIVNVGDIKPMELPTSFFLDYAWNPEKISEKDLRKYYTGWAEHAFGTTHAAAIGDMLRQYAQISARRKPELLDAATYSLHHYNEWSKVVAEWTTLLQKSEAIEKALPATYRDAYFQLVLHPIKAMTNLHQMYHAVALNHFHAAKNDAAANAFADKVKEHYFNDSLITEHYHKGIAGGKWNGMMSQTHIGYTYWQQPPVNKMPEVKYVAAASAGTPAAAVTTVSNTAKSMVPENIKGLVFYEQDGVVAMEAANWSKSVPANGMQWGVVPDIGRSGSGITTFPVTAWGKPGANNAHVAYDFYNTTSGKVTVHLHFSPTLNFHNKEEGLQFAVSIDGEAPQVLSLNKEDKNSISGIWNKWVGENIIVKQASFNIQNAGKHTIRYWAISPGVVLQKLVLDFGGMKPSYLGTPETLVNKNKK